MFSFHRVLGLVCSHVLLLSSTFAQQVAAPAVSPASLLQTSLSAQIGKAQITDVTLSGTLRRVAGSDDETGTATLQAASNGSICLTLNLSSGSHTEVANFFNAPSAIWSGPDGISHAIAYHNLLAESAWFSPSIAVARRLTATNFVATYVGHESFNNQGVEHLSVSQVPSSPDPPGVPTLAHLSQVDFYLDSTTMLPVAISFNTHPDDNSLVDIPVQVLFSDYRSVSGFQIPFHIQKFLNNSLLLDLQIQSASFNSGLTNINFTTE